jgi:hypothetical protein
VQYRPAKEGYLVVYHGPCTVYGPTNEWKGEIGIDFVHAKQIGVRFCNKNKRHHVGRVFKVQIATRNQGRKKNVEQIALLPPVRNNI